MRVLPISSPWLGLAIETNLPQGEWSDSSVERLVKMHTLTQATQGITVINTAAREVGWARLTTNKEE